jgi:hypothetical protein
VARKSWDPERWTYQVREVSAGVYEAVADDHQGDAIRHRGVDPDDLLDRCKRDAAAARKRRRDAASP